MRRLSGVVVLLLICCTAAAQVAVPQPGEAEKRDGTALNIWGGMSLYNTFQRGNLDTWFQQQVAGDSSREVASGSPAFFDVGVGIIDWDPMGFSMGSGVGVQLYNSHALWGTKVVYGGKAEFVLQPTVFYVPLSIRIDISGDNTMLLVADPAFLLCMAKGKLTTFGGTRYRLDASNGMGWHVPVGFEFLLGDMLGLSARAGYRSLKVDVIFDSSASPTGYKQFQVNGQDVQADLSGMFFTFAAALYF
ncbi:MAG: hypothetical protein HQ559_01995 [Lentisphaerae bacterium]|nr:hypothetical protein [Lentisphaerota bacterium]